MAKLLSGTRIYGSATIDTTLSLGTSAIFTGSTSGTTTVIATAVAGTTTLTLPAATDTLVGRATTDTLTNKTLTSPSLSAPTLTGAVTAGGNTGSNGQFLKSTGVGVIWATPGGSTLVSLSDVSVTTPVTSQVLTYNGSVWINATPNVAVASAVFASSAYDMGFVYDVASISEDEGLITGSNNFIYDLGILSFTGIISLNNLDQSVKSDYLGYSIIFGF
jgi:hypothetical protein